MPTVGTRESAAFQGWELSALIGVAPHGYDAEAIRVLVEITDAMAPHAIREAVSQARRVD